MTIDLVDYANEFLRGPKFRDKEYSVCPQCGEDVELPGKVCNVCMFSYIAELQILGEK